MTEEGAGNIGRRRAVPGTDQFVLDSRPHSTPDSAPSEVLARERGERHFQLLSVTALIPTMFFVSSHYVQHVSNMGKI